MRNVFLLGSVVNYIVKTNIKYLKISEKIIKQMQDNVLIIKINTLCKFKTTFLSIFTKFFLRFLPRKMKHLSS